MTKRPQTVELFSIPGTPTKFRRIQIKPNLVVSGDVVKKVATPVTSNRSLLNRSTRSTVVQTLYDFLSQNRLEKYYPACIRIGCSDKDLQTILDFDDIALREFTKIVGMLPFHDIHFRNCVHNLHKNIRTK